MCNSECIYNENNENSYIQHRYMNRLKYDYVFIEWKYVQKKGKYTATAEWKRKLYEGYFVIQIFVRLFARSFVCSLSNSHNPFRNYCSSGWMSERYMKMDFRRLTQASKESERGWKVFMESWREGNFLCTVSYHNSPRQHLLALIYFPAGCVWQFSDPSQGIYII